MCQIGWHELLGGKAKRLVERGAWPGRLQRSRASCGSVAVSQQNNKHVLKRHGGERPRNGNAAVNAA